MKFYLKLLIGQILPIDGVEPTDDVYRLKELAYMAYGLKP